MRKGPEPAVLGQNCAQWTAEFCGLKSSGQTIPDSVRYRYRNPAIKAAILLEAHGKCAYCESKIPHTSPGDIEHITPSSKCPEMAFMWVNLVLACSECNRRKLDYFNPAEPLIHPVDDDPAEHLKFLGALIFPALSSGKGFLTTRKLELNRTALLERRKDRLDAMHTLLELWSTSTPEKKTLLAKQVLQEIQSDREYSATLNAFVKQMCPMFPS